MLNVLALTTAHSLMCKLKKDPALNVPEKAFKSGFSFKFSRHSFRTESAQTEEEEEDEEDNEEDAVTLFRATNVNLHPRPQQHHSSSMQ